MEKKSNKASNLNKIRCQSANSKINQAIKVKVPIVDKSSNDYLENFKMEIVKYIVDNRIYKDDELNKFLENLIKSNSKLIEKETITNIFEQIKNNLDE